jgi:hypothetical protein
MRGCKSDSRPDDRLIGTPRTAQEGDRWNYPQAPGTRPIDEAHVVTGDEPCNDEERRRASARFYALQSMITQVAPYRVPRD